MQTHPDSDSIMPSIFKKAFGRQTEEDALAKLRERTKKMVAEGVSQITAGAPGETEIDSLETLFCGHVRQLPDDDLCLRISVGEATPPIKDLRYVVIRGDPKDCLELLERAVMALKVYAHYREAKQ